MKRFIKYFGITVGAIALICISGLLFLFIYASKNIVVNRFATITDHYDGIAISDHYPIVAEVEFLE